MTKKHKNSRVLDTPKAMDTKKALPTTVGKGTPEEAAMRALANKVFPPKKNPAPTRNQQEENQQEEQIDDVTDEVLEAFPAEFTTHQAAPLNLSQDSSPTPVVEDTTPSATPLAVTGPKGPTPMNPSASNFLPKSANQAQIEVTWASSTGHPSDTTTGRHPTNVGRILSLPHWLRKKSGMQNIVACDFVVRKGTGITITHKTTPQLLTFSGRYESFAAFMADKPLEAQVCSQASLIEFYAHTTSYIILHFDVIPVSVSLSERVRFQVHHPKALHLEGAPNLVDDSVVVSALHPLDKSWTTNLDFGAQDETYPKEIQDDFMRLSLLFQQNSELQKGFRRNQVETTNATFNNSFLPWGLYLSKKSLWTKSDGSHRGTIQSREHLTEPFVNQIALIRTVQIKIINKTSFRVHANFEALDEIKKLLSTHKTIWFTPDAQVPRWAKSLGEQQALKARSAFKSSKSGRSFAQAVGPRSSDARSPEEIVQAQENRKRTTQLIASSGLDPLTSVRVEVSSITSRIALRKEILDQLVDSLTKKFPTPFFIEPKTYVQSHFDVVWMDVSTASTLFGNTDEEGFEEELVINDCFLLRRCPNRFASMKKPANEEGEEGGVAEDVTMHDPVGPEPADPLV